MKNIVKKPLLYVWLIISSMMAFAFMASTIGRHYGVSANGSNVTFQVQSNTNDTVDFCQRCSDICSQE